MESYFSPLLASITCGFGMVFLGAGTITGAVIYKRLSDAINDVFGGFGIAAKNGGWPVALGLLAAGLLGGACGGYVIAYRRQKGKGWKMGGGSERGVEGGEVDVPLVGGYEKQNNGGQRQQQQQQQQQGVVMGDRDVERRMEDDWAAPDEYSGRRGDGNNTKRSSNVPLVSMGAGGNNRQTRNLNTAYEPYSRQQF